MRRVEKVTYAVNSPMGWVGERLGRAKDGDSLTVVSSERLKEGLDSAAAAQSIDKDTS